MLRRRTLGNIVSDNLHNSETDLENIYLNGGKEYTYNGWTATDWIPVTPGKYLITTSTVFLTGSTANGTYNSLYDSGKEVISLFFFGAYKDITQAVLNVPSGCCYVRLSGSSEQVKNIEIYRLDS